jgi:predicted nicotinamide N-methyase
MDKINIYRVNITGVDQVLSFSAPDAPMAPIWASVWPSGVALASVIWRDRERFAGKKVLEIGPGLGITATLLGLAGAEVTLVDISQSCLNVAAYNMRQNGAGYPAHAIVSDIRHPTPDLPGHLERGAYDMIVGADILYEDDVVEPLLRTISAVDHAWIAAVIREPFAKFAFDTPGAGWTMRTEKIRVPIPDPIEGTVDPVIVLYLDKAGRVW